MAIALLPLLASAVGGYALINQGVIANFQDVASRQRSQIIPTQELRLLVWNSLVSIDEFVEEGNPVHQAAYRQIRTRIETEFARLREAMALEPSVQTLVQRARDEWTAADNLATELMSVPIQPGASRAIEIRQRIHGQVNAIEDKLASVSAQLNGDLRADHDMANLFYERSIWLAGIAAAVSLLTVVCGVFMIGRILSGSVDRLVDGAVRFAEGDRDHRIAVRVPPELHRVAEEFNHMIGRIHESEAILSELARRDGLTGLPNRRAFDEALPEMWARIQRHNEQGALLALDIDHFKTINDTLGHAAGDEALKVIAETMRRNSRPFDTVFRTGGEEFAVLLPKTDLVGARQAAERLRKAIEANPARFKDTEINFTVSIGVAPTSELPNPEAMVRAADAALYRAKVKGRNRVVVSGEDEPSNLEVA